MHELLKKLSAEHIELEQTLAGIRPRQFRNGEGRARLQRLKELLYQHLEREQINLYPVLEQAGRKDEKLAAQVRRFSEELKIVTALADDFIRKYDSRTKPMSEPEILEFATDHGALMTVLKIRLKREEEMLFPLFERVFRN